MIGDGRPEPLESRASEMAPGRRPVSRGARVGPPPPQARPKGGPFGPSGGRGGGPSVVQPRRAAPLLPAPARAEGAPPPAKEGRRAPPSPQPRRSLALAPSSATLPLRCRLLPPPLRRGIHSFIRRRGRPRRRRRARTWTPAARRARRGRRAALAITLCVGVGARCHFVSVATDRRYKEAPARPRSAALRAAVRRKRGCELADTMYVAPLLRGSCSLWGTSLRPSTMCSAGGVAVPRALRSLGLTPRRRCVQGQVR
eukprot:scaffold1283_cov321-Prasinococcus_capsulatus_cf.AAC.9